MDQQKNIVIIGAGYAGVAAAKVLAKKYKKDNSVTITLIDRHSYQTMMTELHEVAGARVEPEAIQYDLRRLFAHTKVRIVTDEVTKVDHGGKTVFTKTGTFSYDYLVLGMGSEPNDFGIPGVKEHGFTLWSLEDAVKIRLHIEETVRKAALIHDEKERQAMLTFAVAGSGFTGIEMVGELMEWRDRLAKTHKINKNEIRLMVIEAAPTILNLLGRKDADVAEAYMLKQGVDILKDSMIVELSGDAVVLKSGERIPTHTLIWTAGIKANTDVADYNMEQARAGRLAVNEFMEAKGLEDVYVIGDLAYLEDAEGQPNPQIVEAAEQTGHCAASNIIADISGGEKHAYKGKYHGFMVSIGARYGVADLSGIHLKGWFAILVKHMVNLFYFFNMGTGFYMWRYVEHEFFHVKDNRQIFRGLLTRYGNVLWSLPLRLIMGFFWLNQALGKIYGHHVWGEATRGFENIRGFFGSYEDGTMGIFPAIGHMFNEMLLGIGSDSWLVDHSIRMPFPWLHGDALSGATATATSGATGAGATEWALPIIAEAPGWFQFIMQHIGMPTPEIAVAGQFVIVFFQLIMGFALIAGLFTWLFSFAGAGLLVVLLLSAMLGWDNFWAIPASIALMNGAGRTLGLDYYVQPWIQKQLHRLWYGEVKSIYSDHKNDPSAQTDKSIKPLKSIKG
ncbi:MAG: NAD(P)/FAD-dependent oxidoreductase [Turicibacter sp.]|nr:NAD(P)/FAD-dependent oxidoreductase [Turicibacter sp.]